MPSLMSNADEAQDGKTPQPRGRAAAWQPGRGRAQSPLLHTHTHGHPHVLTPITHQYRTRAARAAHPTSRAPRAQSRPSVATARSSACAISQATPRCSATESLWHENVSHVRADQLVASYSAELSLLLRALGQKVRVQCQ